MPRESVSRTIIDSQFYFTATAQTWFYTGKYIDIPAKSIYAIEVEMIYGGSRPWGRLLQTNETTEHAQYHIAESYDSWRVSFSSYTATALRIYIWGKYENAASNRGFVRGWYMPSQ